ncbi:FkbM family methyltransferase [Elioraea sp.]|uniref:FkbM family methyltransferase n=1 Tax=Elioraea sp. TaxID=2185103 RepID=UPI003F72F411
MIPRAVRWLKRRLNSELAARGYTLSWLPPQVLARREHQLALDFEFLAGHLMLTRPRPFFLGIGANDGVTHDPLYPFIRAFNWPGVMVEPIPEAFAALTRNYETLPHVTLVNAAVGPSDGMGTIYSVAASDKEVERISLHSSFDRAVLLKARSWYPDIEQRIVARDVPVLSFVSVLAHARRQTVDVLKIDTEGYDLEILRMVDLATLAPSIVMAEHANLSRADKVAMAELLLGHGYRVAMTSLDMLAYRGARFDKPMS